LTDRSRFFQSDFKTNGSNNEPNASNGHNPVGGTRK
jgi:hypothetical protein